MAFLLIDDSVNFPRDRSTIFVRAGYSLKETPSAGKALKRRGTCVKIALRISCFNMVGDERHRNGKGHSFAPSFAPGSPFAANPLPDRVTIRP